MSLKVIFDLYKFISSKAYIVGDSLPKAYSLGELDSLDVYKSKKMISILNEFSSNTAIQRLDVASDKPKVSAN